MTELIGASKNFDDALARAIGRLQAIRAKGIWHPLYEYEFGDFVEDLNGIQYDVADVATDLMVGLAEPYGHAGADVGPGFRQDVFGGLTDAIDDHIPTAADIREHVAFCRETA